MYYKDFPRNHVEVDQNKSKVILLPRKEIQAHQNSIFDLEWIKSDTQIATASGDKTCKIIDVESGAEVACLGRQKGDTGHLGSVKCI